MQIAKGLFSKTGSGTGTASQAVGNTCFCLAQRFGAAITGFFLAPALSAGVSLLRKEYFRGSILTVETDFLSFRRKSSKPVLVILSASLCCGLACSPRDFLTRRLAADLISASETFKTPQVFWLKTGIVSNRDFNSPDSMVLQHRGWIIGTQQKCPPGVDPAPCWDVVLSPLGVDVFRPLIADTSPGIAPMSLPVARRELVNITGMSKAGKFADVEFTWRWVALNPVGGALYDGGVYYRSTVGFRSYDDGWRVVNESVKTNQSLEEALHDAEPTAP